MTYTPDPSVIIYEKKGHVAYITLNRPRSLNAINLDLSVAFHDAIEDVKEDDNIFLAIVTGAGRAFCAGADLKEMALRSQLSQEEIIAREQLRRKKGNTIMWTQECWKPIIAAVNGLALGGGFEIAMSCDIIIAASDVRLGLPEAKRGIVPGIGVFKLARQIPLKAAMEIMLTGEDRLSAQRAYELGIVNQVVPVEPDWSEDQKRQAVVAAAEQMAERMLQCAPLSLQAIKEFTMRSWHVPLREAMEMNPGRVFANSEDALEGPRAFVEKRAPVWKNR